MLEDFEEFSQEEIRWEAYQAKTIERVPEYVRDIYASFFVSSR